MRKVRIVTATTMNEVEFRHMTLLGQSLALFPRQAGLEVTVFPGNTGSRRTGLGTLYNSFLKPAHGDEIVLFIHDDVYIHDWHLVHRLNDAIEHYGVVGLAENAAPDLDEPSWMLAWNREKHPSGRQPREFLSGMVGHLVKGTTHVSRYGPAPRECVLLDGVFLAVDVNKILGSGVRFDPQFTFHFYDLDFCRQCSTRGLRLGTWPIAVTHASAGDFGSHEWATARKRYLDKWARDSSQSAASLSGR